MPSNYNSNKLNSPAQKPDNGSGWQFSVIAGVALIAVALLLFGFVFFIGKGDDSSSQGEESSQGETSKSETSQSSESGTSAKGTQSDSSKAETTAAVTTAASAADSSSAVEKTAGNTVVHFIDCGQGDCTLVISGGEAMLIDSGERDDNDNVIKYIKAQGVTKFKYIIVTHPHTDHMGEMPDILKAFKTEKFIMPKVPDNMVPTIMRYEKMLKQVKAQGLTVTWSSDTQFKLGSAVINTYTPKQELEGLNNYSTLVKVTCGERKFLITGDCEKEEEADILSQKFDLTADVLKVPHHGSYEGTTYELLSAVKMKYAVISCGKDNDYGHPHDSTLNRIKKYTNKVYITKDNGTVVFSTDGKELSVTTQR